MGNLRGAVLMIIAMGLYAFEDLLIKLASVHVAIGQLLLCIGVLGSLILAVVVRFNRRPLLSRDFLHPMVITRNLGELVGAFALVTALALTPLASAASILQAQPLAVTLLAALFLGETVGWRRWLAILVGFAGMLLIIRPGTADFDVASLLAVLAVACFAIRDLATRVMPRGMNSLQVSLWAYYSIALIGAILTLKQGNFAPVPSNATWMLIGIVLAGTLGYYLIVEAVRASELSAIAPFRYFRLVVALILGAIFLAERPDTFTLTGAALIVGSGLYALARERAVFTAARQG
ncbi:DMT family transporter [Aliiruegeria sabulilitoris]|uniref:DMT family transporter n=1 Tax=Aliiruegeria sabulilitoris TaxID=1510458 RepID=UPI00082DDF75|nr:DMT family transporter [Aliiruegeria sabulilitoris]NDR58197.1 DMT family transporter [Pseudoruegeria sp. M32A2M]